MNEDEWIGDTLEKFLNGPGDIAAYPIPEHLTSSGRRFYAELHTTLSMLLLFTNASVFADNAAHVSKEIIRGSSELPQGCVK
jgi:hypothetical protein